MRTNLRVQVCSDVDYERLVVEIYQNEKFVALISQEGANRELAVEFPGPDQNQSIVLRKVELNWFKMAIEEAERALIGGHNDDQTSESI
jgi:hypothetical protein